MRLYSSAILIVLLLVMSTAADCSPTDVNQSIDAFFPGNPLASSTKPEDKAAAQSHERTQAFGQAGDDLTQATDPANLNKGKNMSFDKIQNAEALNPDSYVTFYEEAAMRVAAGQDPTDALTYGRRNLDKLNKSSQHGPATDNDTRVEFAISLSTDYDKLQPGATKDNVKKALCDNVALLKANGYKFSDTQANLSKPCS